MAKPRGEGSVFNDGTLREPTVALRQYIHDFLEALDTPRALSVWLLYKSGEHRQLVDLECDPLRYLDAQGALFRDDYAATLFLRKSDFLATGIDLTEAAKKKFFAAEERCATTNKKLRNLSSAPDYTGPTASVLHTASRKIERLLGDFDVDEWVDGCDWGPGVSTHVKGDTSREAKFWSATRITPCLRALVEPFFGMVWPEWATTFQMEDQLCNVVTFVPKDARGHRSIAMEPDLNIWFQKGLGNMIRRRLKRRAGIDLNDQSANQRACRRGASSGRLATLDKSSASDLMCYEGVRLLVNDDTWFHVLDVCRSKLGRIDKQVLRWEKFSSMGNGFTFELQSMIFWAIAESACEHLGLAPEVYVYGDDVILPVEAASLYTQVVEFLGFKLNLAKSFSSGKFRESCGSHYYGVLDCQPLYLKKGFGDVLDVYKAANAVRLLAARRNCFLGCDGRFERTHYRLTRQVSTRWRVGIPHGYGDQGFVVDFDDPLTRTVTPAVDMLGTWSQKFSLRAGLTGANLAPFVGGFRCLVFRRKPVEVEANHAGVLFARLSGGRQERDMGNSYSLRGQTQHIREDLLWVPRWHSPTLEWVGS